MKIVYHKNEWDEKAVMATIGFFDGVHPGHRFLLREMQSLAKERGIPTAVITFPVHPRVVMNAEYQPKLLNSLDEKLNLLSKTGIDFVIVMDFTPAVAAMSAYEFITSVLIPELHVRTLFVGFNHRFGYQGSEGFEPFIRDGKVHGMEVIKMPSFCNDNGIVVSSSVVRRLIEKGDVTTAARLLGYHYQLKGCVIEGNRIGQMMGFPTANIRIDEPYKVIPKAGSYAVRIILHERNFYGMLYIGLRQTIGMDDTLHIEVNIFDFSEDIYNKTIIVEFLSFLREDEKFESLDELREQITLDKQQAEAIGADWQRQRCRCYLTEYD